MRDDRGDRASFGGRGCRLQTAFVVQAWGGFQGLNLAINKAHSVSGETTALSMRGGRVRIPHGSFVVCKAGCRGVVPHVVWDHGVAGSNPAIPTWE